MTEVVEYLWTDMNPKDDFRPDWSLKRAITAGRLRLSLSRSLCGPCNFGEADTLNGEWWDEQNDEMK